MFERRFVVTEILPKRVTITHPVHDWVFVGRRRISVSDFGSPPANTQYRNAVPVHVLVPNPNVDAFFGSSRLMLSSPASTILTVRPNERANNPLYRIAVRAYDVTGRLVETAGYDLSLFDNKRPASFTHHTTNYRNAWENVPAPVTPPPPPSPPISPPPPPQPAFRVSVSPSEAIILLYRDILWNIQWTPATITVTLTSVDNFRGYVIVSANAGYWINFPDLPRQVFLSAGSTQTIRYTATISGWKEAANIYKGIRAEPRTLITDAITSALPRERVKTTLRFKWRAALGQNQLSFQGTTIPLRYHR
jgi:hypothetical protein